jgi:uncharacterized membrane protein YkvA (DUF1232 family)
MSLTITFELGDSDIEHFLSIAEKAQASVRKSGIGAEQITTAARELFEQTDDESLPEFIGSRLRKLETLVNMVEDAEWKLPDEDLTRVLNAMAYFADPEDLIPDRIPGLGFLDDAIMVELVVVDLDGEIAAYEEFCAFRSAEEKRRVNQGLDTHVGREDWLADKRAVLHNRMRKLRRDRKQSPIRGIKLW